MIHHKSPANPRTRCARGLAPLASLLFACFALIACGKKEQPQAKPAPPQALATAIPALALLPEDADFVVVLNKPADLFDRVLGSAVLRDFFALPFIKKEVEAQGYAGDPTAWLNEALDRDPQGRQRYDLVRDLIGQEVFVVFPKGTAAQIDVWTRVYEELQFAQMFKDFATEPPNTTPDNDAQGESPVDPPPAEAATNASRKLAAKLFLRFKPLVEQVEIPALLVGIHPGEAGRAYLDRRVEALLEQISEKALRGEMDLAGSKLQTLDFALGDLVPASALQKARSEIEQEIGPGQEASDFLALFDQILARRALIAYGHINGRFLLSLSKPGVLPPLATRADAALVFKKELDHAGQYADKNPFLFLYQSQAFVEATRPRLGLERSAQALRSLLPPGSLSDATADKIAEDARRLDEEFSRISAGESSAAVGIGFIDSGIRITSKGGYSMPVLATAGALRTTGLLDAGAAIYLGWLVDDAGQERVIRFVEDLFSTALNTFKTVGLPQLSQSDQQNFAVAESLFIPKWLTLWDILKDLSMKALGPEGGLVADVAEQMPNGEMVPEALRGKGRMPSLSLLASIRDERLLGECWARLMAWANDITTLIPPMPGIQRPLPEPQTRAAAGATSYFYPLQEILGEDAPGVTVGDKLWFLGTSIKAQERLLAALPKEKQGEPASLLFEVQSEPIRSALRVWLDLAAANPEADAQAGGANSSPSAEELDSIKAALDFTSRFKSFGYRRSETGSGPLEDLWLEVSAP